MLQLSRPLAGGSLSLPFGPAPQVLAEPSGWGVKDDVGWLRRRNLAFPGAASFPHFHNAQDWSGPEGTPLLAPADGRIVTRTTSYPDGARYISLEIAPGVRAYHWHLLDWANSTAGKEVGRGDVIAHMGSTGWSTGPHTHFEVRVDIPGQGTFYYNPVRLLEGGDLGITPDGFIEYVTQGGLPVNLATDIPTELVDVAAGTSPVDSVNGKVLIPNWAGAPNVGRYAKDVGAGRSLVRLNLGDDAHPDLHAAYVPNDHVIEPAPPATGDVATAQKAAADAVAKAAATEAAKYGG